VKTRIALIVASALSLMATNVHAAFPEKPVTIIVPYAAGGVTDTIARIVGQKLSETWGKQVIIENKPGAAGAIGVAAAVKARPDGYTLLFSTSSEITVNPAVYRKLAYDPLTQLLPIRKMATMPMAWVVNKNVPVTSLEELVAKAKAEPGKVTYSSVGNGSVNHLAGEMFAAATGIKMLHAAYNGGAPATTAVVSGEVMLGMVTYSSALPFLKTGEIRMLGVTTQKPPAADPNARTIGSSMIPGYDVATWLGVYAPVKMPPDIADAVGKAIDQALKDEKVTESLTRQGFTTLILKDEELRAQIKKDISQFKKVAADLNLYLD
jgi:tripartite-type tricarboxylate transporter receptor subunit TctC